MKNTSVIEKKKNGYQFALANWVIFLQKKFLIEITETITNFLCIKFVDKNWQIRFCYSFGEQRKVFVSCFHFKAFCKQFFCEENCLNEIYWNNHKLSMYQICWQKPTNQILLFVWGKERGFCFPFSLQRFLPLPVLGTIDDAVHAIPLLLGNRRLIPEAIWHRHKESDSHNQ